ncbi:MAG: AtpZ/AtpI family protein [Cyanobacteria bacterium SZAS LIN-3]|nr:AtpZ/AtpI family protein [Cyanobacteria bacterium SZAS LIN-3]MBS2009253.1 AtpZ/AtpI family protein [Cyanobacteria bacterium SZAS TMP-1]
MIASELGSVIVVSVGLGYFAGNWLDGMLKCSPYGIVGGLMLGMGLGLGIVVKRSNQLDKNTPRVKMTSSQEPEPPAEDS